MPSYLNKTLEELDGQNWGAPEYNSYLVTTCHRLRRVPLKDFVVEDLRIMIGQGIGLVYLIPLALERLENHPFAAGDFYPGDLLKYVLGISRTFWEQHPKSLLKMNSIVEKAKAQIEVLDDDEIKTTLQAELDAFG